MGGESSAEQAEAELSRALRALLPAGGVGTARWIRSGDEAHLRLDEQRHLRSAVTSVRRASGAARVAARSVATQLGLALDAVPHNDQRAPVWPPGLVGSLAHDRDCAVAVLAPSKILAGVGVDVEPIQTLEPDLAELLGEPSEFDGFDETLAANALFSIKEAVYKAVHPLDGVFLDFKDVRVAVDERSAVTHYGRRVHWRLALAPRVLAVAWVEGVASA